MNYSEILREVRRPGRAQNDQSLQLFQAKSDDIMWHDYEGNR